MKILRQFHPTRCTLVLLVWASILIGGCSACESVRSAEIHTLWRIGNPDNSAAEFALNPDGYTKFLEKFGSPDHAFYIGLSNPQDDWPYVLPGPLDVWASCQDGGRWDQMNTLPIGFVLDHAPNGGQCVLNIDLCDTQPEHPPTLRITVNGTIYEHDLAKGGSDDSLHGDMKSAKKQTVRVEFPASLLLQGYNEVALRNTRGSWLVFDALSLDTPAGAKLAPTVATMIRSVCTAPYAVSMKKETAATLRVELFRAKGTGTLNVQFGQQKMQTFETGPGLQVLEIPAPASPEGKGTQVRLQADGRLVYNGTLEFSPSPTATPADYVDVFKG